jgi:hypothetical protein
MSETAHRQIRMLQLIPREPWKISAPELVAKLSEAGFEEVTLRTVQRDLNAISKHFPIRSDDREKPFGWFWIKDAPAFGLPALDPQTALTLKLAQNYMNLELPTATLDYLSPYFKAAGKSRPIGATESRPNGASGRCGFSSFGRGCF